ncbi:GNAT family N-acetyltransferase [Candidatus Symbiopectobacterium sp. NZEC127]|uniref:GNAT family N-acetyltransferase n=1 Tax=Candidatus Symbiopectobacterium sp. NZEC127 TaxID=2820472 RepID=UPI0022277825|nr:GNAT family protein [Candidatus Symbiopectobacterium sp. NZEC127]MCW2484887.1 GNAT family N-acetyltransferase [Candidatus Symbiopectobacterium sp. NZEC127]
MAEHLNRYGQPVGAALPLWSARAFPGGITLTGRFCRIEPLNVAQHLDALYAAHAAAPDGRDWTYMFVGPFGDKDAFRAYLTTAEQQQDSQCYVVIDTLTDNAVGTFSLMRVDVNHGVIEVGSVAFSSALKRTPLATEAHFLLMGYVFEQLNYRRYEWKCDSLNAPSRRAALRLGFTFEGIFRQAIVYKGRTRDTAWFSLLDNEWPQRKLDFIDWLAPGNFDTEGKQIQSLADIRQSRLKGGS